VTEQQGPTHPTTEQIQELLDGALPESQAEDVRNHAASCARCQSRLEAWSTLFEGLDTLEELAPDASFSGRVMDALPEGAITSTSLAVRLRRWVGLSSKKPTPTDHLEAGHIQELLDGVLAPSAVMATEAHLRGCRGCREDIDAWRTVMAQLDVLPRIAPSKAFAERVMAHVRVRDAVAVARPGLRERLQSWVAVHPHRLQRFAALAGAGVTPVTTLALMTYSVVSHPLVSPSSLTSFLWLKTRTALSGLGTDVAAQVGTSSVVGRLLPLLETLTSSTQTAALACLLFVGLVASASWVLYRNLFAKRLVWNRNEQLPF
jgi:anti-sigma factor RsiW